MKRESFVVGVILLVNILLIVSQILASSHFRSSECTDSDGGRNFNVNGVTSGFRSNSQTLQTERDYCGDQITNLDDNILTEFYCSDENEFKHVRYECPIACRDGECKDQVCVENWSCKDWSECLGNQTRVCSDLNNCESEKNKPKEFKFCSQTCIEDWRCTLWTDCRNSNYQYRNCTDVSKCEESNRYATTRRCGLSLDKDGVDERCEDTDGGRNIYVKGVVIDDKKVPRLNYSDYCRGDGKTLIEFYSFNFT